MMVHDQINPNLFLLIYIKYVERYRERIERERGSRNGFGKPWGKPDGA